MTLVIIVMESGERVGPVRLDGICPEGHLHWTAGDGATGHASMDDVELVIGATVAVHTTDAPVAQTLN